MLKTDHYGREWPLQMWKGTPGCTGPSGPAHLQTCPEFSGLTQRWPLSPSAAWVREAAVSSAHPGSLPSTLWFLPSVKRREEKGALKARTGRDAHVEGERTGGDGRPEDRISEDAWRL